MDQQFLKIKNELREEFGAIAILRKKPLFYDMEIKTTPFYKKKVMSYIYSKYHKFLRLRVDMDDALIYTYLLVPEKRIEKVKADMKDHQRRFKWLYAQIKDEEIFIKNAKIIKEDKENGS